VSKGERGNLAGTRRRMAVVGSGVAGLTAAYLLQGRFDVTLYEAADRLGGHADTHDVVTADAGTIAVDTGFIVYNDATYPQFGRLLARLGLATQTTDMSMSVRCEGCGLEYAGGRGPGGVLARPRSMRKLAFLKMLVEINRFHREAKAMIADGDDGLTLRQFLVNGGYSDYFTRHFVVPIVASVWSAPTGVALEYPARYLFIFLHNHGMLSVTGSPQWRTITGGSRMYVERVAKTLHAVQTATPVRRVRRAHERIEIRDECDEVATFDAVVMATHADTTLSLLDRPSAEELSVLGAFGYARNDTWLHRDERLLPRAKRAQSSWNYLLPACDADTDGVFVTYDMNRLQSLPSSAPHLVTLNATARIDPSLVMARMAYEHPIYTVTSVAAQRRLPGLNSRTIAFAGAYHGWGFHEDGCRSGVAAAESFGATW
jgi:predicted NAD/FAD-binding protein